MPEIAEVARIVHFLRLHVVGKRIASASAIDDKNVFGKVGTTGADVEVALKGKKIVSAGSQGKYFWITLESPPHLVMHFGMTGWVHIKGEKTAYTNYYKKMKDEDMAQWPPKFWKFQFATEGTPAVEVAFTDSRRFGRVRLVDCPGDQIRKHSPLVENGPDPVVDLDRFTEEYLRGKMRARHVPIKALLLDQVMISGIGNWVADETLYQAKLHPEQYCDEFDDAQITTLYENIRYVCQTSVDELGDSDQFPKHWLFNYRWGKGTKGTASKLPNGEKLAFITVGGRTSCYAPGVQKKTGRTVPGIKAEPVEADATPQVPKKSRKKNTSEFWDEGGPPAKKKKAVLTKAEPIEDEVKTEPVSTDAKPELGRRRSTRLRK
ncbi:Formamidopyrimidine-DNA glycosylase N-terminal domain-containing protein [Dactylonectria estremocensis]|uniref:Formamidopyrimidine-DNA glycosylase N-terminal domain-containing protein n=1 Tax=Dactylonectria estremocensis TaxID=1079267 RepID=A0A9P9FC89_9HYPO|nr:Formamidopyrimidine-DNA glycosylase N-terminal domain-containing protein [Dactylonectria estremocensis]